LQGLENIHPGELLHLDFMEPLGISAYRLAREIQVPQTRISQIVRGLRRITPDMAIRLGIYFGTTPQFWLNLQNHFDTEAVRLEAGDRYEAIRPFWGWVRLRLLNVILNCIDL
jgi:addiction module HigA family antidote